MRKHYESLNYMDGQPGTERFSFTRTQGSHDGYITMPRYYDGPKQFGPNGVNPDRSMCRADVVALRDMLSEILEDWK